eukprot:scaffold167956_cov36-Tisochrysis_lutea.AAC.2
MVPSGAYIFLLHIVQDDGPLQCKGRDSPEQETSNIPSQPQVNMQGGIAYHPSTQAGPPPFRRTAWQSIPSCQARPCSGRFPL